MTVLVRQPKRSRLCGQACVAMVLGVTLAEAVRLVGHRRGTTAKVLRAVLRRRGVKLGRPVVWRVWTGWPRHCILRVSRKSGRGWHWMLCSNGQILDPAGLWPDGYPGGKITSYMEVVINEGKQA